MVWICWFGFVVPFFSFQWKKEKHKTNTTNLIKTTYDISLDYQDSLSLGNNLWEKCEKDPNKIPKGKIQIECVILPFVLLVGLFFIIHFPPSTVLLCSFLLSLLSRFSSFIEKERKKKDKGWTVRPRYEMKVECEESTRSFSHLSFFIPFNWNTMKRGTNGITRRL